MRVTPCRTTLRRAEVEACNDGLLRNFFFVSPTHVTWRFFLFMLSNTGSAPAARSHTTHTHKRAPASKSPAPSGVAIRARAKSSKFARAPPHTTLHKPLEDGLRLVAESCRPTPMPSFRTRASRHPPQPPGPQHRFPASKPPRQPPASRSMPTPIARGKEQSIRVPQSPLSETKNTEHRTSNSETIRLVCCQLPHRSGPNLRDTRST